MRGTSEAALELIGLAYATVDDDGDWRGFLAALGSTLDAVVPGVFVLGNPGDVPILVKQDGIDPTWQQAFESHYVTLDVRRPLIKRLGEGAVFRGQDVMPDREFVHTEFFNDFLRPQGLFHIAGGVFLKDPAQVGVVRVLRPPDAPPFGQRERRVLEGLLPHLKRAVLLQQRLGATHDRGRVSEQVLDRWKVGVVLVDGTGLLVWSNRKGAELAQTRNGLAIDRMGRLVATHPDDTNALRRLIATAAIDRDRLECGGGALTLRRRLGRRPLHALVTAMRGTFASLPSRGASAVLLVSDPEDAVEAPLPVVQRHLGVTASEARLAVALARGRSVAEAARELGISELTARTQLKRVLTKTGAHRQAELVRLVLSGPGSLS